MSKVKYSLLGLLLLLLSCESEPTGKRSSGSQFNPDELEKLEKEVMRIHDEVMPRMTDIQKLNKRIKLRLDSASSYPDKHIAELKRAQEGLDDADKAMWDWMYQYNLDSVKGKTEKKLYLVDERAEIRQVQSRMLNSIDYAEQTLKQGEKDQ